MAPLADAVYPIRASTPHECVGIHSYTMFSEEFVITCHIPQGIAGDWTPSAKRIKEKHSPQKPNARSKSKWI